MPTLPLQLSWTTRDVNGQLFRLYDLILPSVRTDGVYVIYVIEHQTPQVIYVGQGVVADRLAVHRTNQTIRATNVRSTVYVTFASVPTVTRNGVERFLADRLRPMLGDAHPTALPVAVSLPFAA